MKRIYAYLDNREFNALTTAAESGRGGRAKFVREAVREKLDRDRVLHQVDEVRDALDTLLADVREEVARSRRELEADNGRGLARMLEELAKSLRKNEEMQKVFLLTLAGQLLDPPRSRRPAAADDGPPDIPG